MSQIINYIKDFVSNKNQKTSPGSSQSSVESPTFTPKVPVWSASNTNREQSNAVEKLEAQKELHSNFVAVPVYKNDAERDVVRRSINTFADQANLSDDLKQVFVKKWIGELEENGRVAVKHDGEAEKSAAESFISKVDSSTANPITGLLGIYRLAIEPDKQAKMTCDIKVLQNVAMSAANISNPQLRKEVKAEMVKIVVGTNEEQRIAAQKLLQQCAPDQAEASKVYAAIKDLANCNEMRFNSALKTAILKIDADKFQQASKQIVESITPLVLTSQIHTSSPEVKKKDAQKTANSENRDRKASENDWVDKQALELLSNLGLNKKFTGRK